jgi:hypothetical protein
LYEYLYKATDYLTDNYSNLDRVIALKDNHVKMPACLTCDTPTILKRDENGYSFKRYCCTTCNKEFADINTRLEDPPIFIRETTITRFDYPIVPHTSYLYDGFENTLQTGNSRSGVNTRLMAKDNFAKDTFAKE